MKVALETFRHWLFFAQGAVGVRRAPAAAPAVGSFKERGQFDEWLPESGPGEARNGSPTTRKVGGRWVQVAYCLIDTACVCGNAVLAFLLRFSFSDHWWSLSPRKLELGMRSFLAPYFGCLLLYVALILLFCERNHLYSTPRNRSASEESFAVVKAVSFATLLLTAFIFLAGAKIVSRTVVAASYALNGVTLVAWRHWKRQIVMRRVARGIGAHNALIVGAGKVGQALASQLERNPLLGYRFVGFLDSNHSNDPRLLGRIDDLSRVSCAQFVDEIFITIPSERELVKSIATEARRQGLGVKVVPELYDGLAWQAPMQQIGDFPVTELSWRPIPTLGFFLKRLMDLFVSGFLLLVCSPLLALLAIWIKLDSRGPVLYRSPRIGRKGKSFVCYKFRTMVANADKMKDELRHLNERDGPFFKIRNDPRVTRAGGFLRKYSLDELPQFWNVLKGDMSLVGPRPHPLDDYQRYKLEHLRRLDVKPGMTGLWQVTSRQDPSFETNMAMDLDYIAAWSFWLDLKILLKTLPAALRGTGA